MRDVVEAYRSNLSQSVRHVGALPQSTVLLEVRLDDSSPLCGRALKETGLPADTLVLSVEREGDVVFPRANTKMESGDVVMILADKSSSQALQTYLNGAAAANGV